MIIKNNTHKLQLRKSAKVVNALLTGALSLSLLSLNASATTIWEENFEAASLQGKGATGPIPVGDNVVVDGVDRWSIDVTNAEITASSDWFRVNNNAMQARDVDGEAIWETESIDISGQGDISLEVALSESGTFESDDYIDVYYSLDGGAFQLVTQNDGDSNTVNDDFDNTLVTANVGAGSSLVVRVAMLNGASSEYYNLDSVKVIASGTTGGDNPDNGGDTPDNGGEPSTELLVLSGSCFNCPDLQAINLASDYVESDYYAALNTAIANSENAVTLKSTAHDIIENGHRMLSYSEVWTALTYTDEDPANTNNVLLFYKGTSQAKSTNGSGSQSTNQDNWNREHVWAKSHGFSSSSLTAYTDILHLRPTDISVNSSRGNLDFDFSDSALTEAPANRIDGDSFEPRDAVKGDVARSMLYMDVRYDGNTAGDTEEDLVLLNRLTTTDEAAFGKLCVLLQWHESDPVDDFERRRNERVFEFQGNRNPFIDKPELASLIYNESCDGSVTDPDTGGTDPDTGGTDPDTGDGTNPDTNPSEPTSSNSVYISEYVEGGGFNKGIELFNSSSEAVSLSGYALVLYTNGASGENDGKVLELEGSIASGGVATYANSQADALLTDGSTISNFVINFNGDDYIELTYNGEVVDALGTFSVRTNWGKDVTLVRKSTVTGGNPNRNSSFDPSAEWDSYAKDTLDQFGAHNGVIAEPTDPTDPTDPVDPVPTVVLISAIQGEGDASSMVGTDVVVEAVVTKVVPGMDGFFVQEEASDSDNNAATSEGVFVYAGPSGQLPQPGDLVRVAATVGERFGATQLTSTADVEVIGAGDTVLYTAVSLPLQADADLEAFEGMQVSFEQTLEVTDIYNLGRYGQFAVSSQRLMIPTNQFEANSQEALALAQQNARDALLVDDGYSSQNRDGLEFPVGGLSHNNTLRLGDSVESLQGVLHYAFGAYNLIPVGDVQTVRTNARTPAPQLNALGDVKVASFNVLNYFNGPDFPTSRGADSAEEFARQQAKTVAAIVAMDADVLGLVEIENDGYGSDSAIAGLVNSVNAELGSDAYAYIALETQLGGDEIAVGMLYKPAVVTPAGAPITSDAAPFDFGNRQPLIQNFSVNSNGESFAFAINHFKSKGSCSSATGNNADLGDGQGCWNELRTEAAQGLLALIEQNSEVLSDRVLIMGDLNAYAKETPILTLESEGYSNLVELFDGSNAYSYSFGGEMGYLDHALTSSSLTEYVVDTTVWHINADEPRVFDYNVEFKSETQLTSYYGSDAYRSSDHDPVVVVMNFPDAVMVGDLDGDNDVDYDDIMMFYQAFISGQANDERYDFNGDGVVNFFDIQALMAMCSRAGCAV
jgi:predicted extracellular nuclease/endonuclease I